MRNNRSEIWCGLANNYRFKPIGNIEKSAIKTYSNKGQALEAVRHRREVNTSDVEVVPITETYESID